jgi:hypothetical protein
MLLATTRPGLTSGATTKMAIQRRVSQSESSSKLQCIGCEAHSQGVLNPRQPTSPNA